MTLIASLTCVFIIVPFFLIFTTAYSDMAIIQNDDVIIRFDESIKNAAKEVVELYPRIKNELEDIFGWKIDFKPSIVLVKENARLQEITDNPYVVAFADPYKNVIVIDHSKMNVNPFTLAVTVKHEVCHLFMGRNISGDHLPRWLNEGFCQWVTGGVAELMIDDRQPNLNKASLSRRLIPLRSLHRNFPSERDQLALAYEESKNVVEYMVAEYGQRGVVRIMNSMKDGNAIDEAIQKSISVSLDELERRWILYLQERVTWAGYLAANIYTILLFAAALLTICGFLRVIIRKRRRNSQTDENEEEIGIN